MRSLYDAICRHDVLRMICRINTAWECELDLVGGYIPLSNRKRFISSADVFPNPGDIGGIDSGPRSTDQHAAAS